MTGHWRVHWYPTCRTKCPEQIRSGTQGKPREARIIRLQGLKGHQKSWWRLFWIEDGIEVGLRSVSARRVSFSTWIPEVLRTPITAQQRDIHREQRSLCELISWGVRSETLLFFEWSCRPWINKQLLIFVDQLEGNPPNSDHLLLEWHPFFSHAKGWTFIRGWQHVGHGVDRSENPCFGPWEQEYSAFRCYRIDIHLYIYICYIYMLYIYICYIYIYVLFVYMYYIYMYYIYIYVIYMLYIYVIYIYICYVYIYVI